MSSTAINNSSGRKNLLFFLLFWAVTFILYFPAVKAGWVIDAVGWIHNLKHQSFRDFINCTQSDSQSLYQLYALDFFVFYKLFGVNVWIWSFCFMTLHAVNAGLLYSVTRKLLSDSGITNCDIIALSGTILFLVCPHVSEVVIWKACFHYLQGFLFIMLIIHWAIRYQQEQSSKYILGSLIVYAISAFSLEIFYLTPFFVLFIALYYRFALNYDKAIFRKTMTGFFLPLAGILIGYFILLYLRYRHFSPHVNNAFTQSIVDYLSKPPKYLFHFLALGRYFSGETKDKVSAFFGKPMVLIIFYGIIALAVLDGLTRFKKMNGHGRAIFLFFMLTMMSIAFLMPINFPPTSTLVFYDRYMYLAAGFFYTLLALIIGRYANKYIIIAVMAAFAVVNMWFTWKVNMYWKHSAYVTNRLLDNLPDAGNRKILFLNLPENMNGVGMIGSSKTGQVNMMSEILKGREIKSPTFDVVSYNMKTPADGAHITISNDSIIHVTLNQWDTWWWYDGHGARSYENEEYKVNMVDAGHWYELTLKKPASEYLILFQSGDQWHVVNMNKRNEDQY